MIDIINLNGAKVSLSMGADPFILFEPSREFAEVAYRLDQKRFIEKLQGKGFKCGGWPGQKEMYVLEKYVRNIDRTYVLHEEEGALVRSINACGATLSRAPELTFNKIDLIFNTTNLASIKAQDLLYSLCKQYVSIINSLRSK